MTNVRECKDLRKSKSNCYLKGLSLLFLERRIDVKMVITGMMVSSMCSLCTQYRLSIFVHYNSARCYHEMFTYKQHWFLQTEQRRDNNFILVDR